ncbi:hypothetical protein ACOMHN_061230 [Nucella lapillus]
MAKLNPWDEAPTTFTEFGPLSSEVKPAGSFFSRWLRRGKADDTEHSGSSSRTGSTASSREGSVERRQISAQPLPVSDRLIRASSTDRGLALNRRDSDLGASVGGGSVGGIEESGETTTAESVSDGAKTVEEEESNSVGGDNSSQSGESSDGRVGQMADRMAPRNLSSVLSRLSNILDRRSTTPQTYKDSDFKQYWMPDSSCKECYDCGDRFTTFRRRHHCRICGQIFCSKCCNQELPGKIIGYKGGIRVCDYCCKVVLRYAQQSVSTGEVKVLREEIRNMSSSQLDIESGSFEFGMWSPVAKRRPVAKEDLTLPQQRTSTLERHVKTTDHQQAVQGETLQKDFSQASEVAAQKNVYNSADASIMSALQTAFWLAKEDLPVNKYSSLMELQKLQGCDAVAQLSVAGNASYMSRASGEEFQECLAEEIHQKIVKKVCFGGSKSGNRKCELEEIQKILNDPVVKIKECHEIRWISFFEAVRAVFSCWASLVTYFSSREDSRSKGLYRKLSDYKFPAVLAILNSPIIGTAVHGSAETRPGHCLCAASTEWAEKQA